jgi:hypothetical protein
MHRSWLGLFRQLLDRELVDARGGRTGGGPREERFDRVVWTGGLDHYRAIAEISGVNVDTECPALGASRRAESDTLDTSPGLNPDAARWLKW